MPDNNDTDPEEELDNTTEEAPKTKSSNARQGGSGEKMVPEKQYTGLQRTYDRLHDRFTALEERYEIAMTELEELKQAQRHAGKAESSLQAKLDEKDREIQSLQAKLEAADRRAERQKLIASEYPELVEFEAKGLLPEADDEESLKEKLDTFVETMGDRVKKGVDKKVKGAGPGPTGKQETPEGAFSDADYDRMISLAGSNDPTAQGEYNKLHQRWLESLD